MESRAKGARLRTRMDRRGFIALAGAAAGAVLLAGCDELSQAGSSRSVLESAEDLTQAAQRLLLGPHDLAPEYEEADISATFKPNGNTSVADPAYRAMAQNGFLDYRLTVDGLVDRPLSLSLAELRTLPARTQITRHDCVEGWSCIGKWKGVPLGGLLQTAGLQADARFLVFHCADSFGDALDGSGRYYESVGREDAFHPQTILAYEMNDQLLPIPHGAPLRLRLERQLGYKMAKYVMRVEAVESFAGIHKGNGGYWEDQGYEWYAGI